MGTSRKTPADRTRIQKAAAERRHAREMKQMKVMLILCAAIIAVAGIGMLVKNAVSLPAEIRDPSAIDDEKAAGESTVSLPAEILDLSAIEEDWIVIDTDSSVGKRYHHPASFTVPEGYTRSEYRTFNDGVQQNFYIEADSGDAVVASLNVFAAANWSAKQYIQRVEDMRDSALNKGSTVRIGEPFSATVAGRKAECIYLAYTAQVDGETKAYGCLFVGFDAPCNVCVYAALTGAYTEPESIQSVETLLAEADTLLSGLTIGE
ncbi:MAG: hypothetical protein ACI4MG_05125 [Aristaeellaceae bacterium]